MAKKKRKKAKKRKKKKKPRAAPKIEEFNFPEGIILARKYQVVDLLGKGWEGEVYLLKELMTGVLRAGKFFYPHRNTGSRVTRLYAHKLHKLRHCQVLVHYHTQELIWYRGHRIAFMVSEYVEGELLGEFLKRQPGKRIGAFQALHLLHALAKGLEEVHRLREYHGDLHTDNVMVRRTGLGFDLKVFDLYHWRATKPEMIQEDVFNLIFIFYEAIGGKKQYSKQPEYVKEICCGLKRSLIEKKYKTAGKLREYLESMEWL